MANLRGCNWPFQTLIVDPMTKSGLPEPVFEPVYALPHDTLPNERQVGRRPAVDRSFWIAFLGNPEILTWGREGQHKIKKRLADDELLQVWTLWQIRHLRRRGRRHYARPGAPCRNKGTFNAVAMIAELE